MQAAVLSGLAGGQVQPLRLAAPEARVPREVLHRWRARLAAGHTIARLPQRHGSSEGAVRLIATHRLSMLLADAEATLTAGFAVLRARYTVLDQLRFGFGQPSLDPARRGDDLLPLCVDYHPAEGFAAFRDRINQAMRDVRADRLPSELLVQDMLRQAGADRHPLGALTLHVRPVADLPVGVTCLLAPRPAAQGECVLLAEVAPDGIVTLTADRAEGLHEHALIARFLSHLDRLLAAALAKPDQHLATSPPCRCSVKVNWPICRHPILKIPR